VSAEFIAILSVGATLVGVVAAFGAVILTSMHRMETRLNKRIDDAIADGKSDNAALEVRSNARFDEAKELNQTRFDEIRAQNQAKFDEAREQSQARFDEAREQSQARFDEAREQIQAMQARTDKGFADIHEELRVTNNRMASIEQRQARLEGLLDGLREALFQRVQQ